MATEKRKGPRVLKDRVFDDREPTIFRAGLWRRYVVRPVANGLWESWFQVWRFDWKDRTFIERGDDYEDIAGHVGTILSMESFHGPAY